MIVLSAACHFPIVGVFKPQSTRTAKPTVNFIDRYCEGYQDLFPEVRSFESFKNLHLGIVSDTKRKTLPAIAKVAGFENPQSLDHFLINSPWDTAYFR
jgi:SRSO17 transposase